ncbi:MAG: ORC1-type DNA replication protein [Methanosarcinaceae archaeon]|nr:ORC1-type DNA replication protein [Methanosarcinaceae archaeon]
MTDTDRNMLMWDETIFREPEIFELDYLPPYFPHRDEQLDAIRYALKPALRNVRPLNCLLYGPPGTGKTSAAKKVIEDFLPYADHVIMVKVNCQIDSTRFAVVSRIYRAIMGVAPPGSGVSFNRIFEKFIGKLIETDRTLIVVLDDINYLFYEGNANEVMYSLLRAHEQYPGSRIGVMTIVNDPAVIYGFDQRVSSVYLPEEIEFRPYSLREIDDILSDRIRNGFYPGVVSDDVRSCIVRHVAETGDLRSGMDLLKRSGMNAEKRSSRTISEEDVEKAYAASRTVYHDRLLETLSAHEKLILEIVEKEGGITAGDLFDRFSEKADIGYTRYYEILNKMIAAGTVTADFSGKGVKGRTRLIRPGIFGNSASGKTRPSDRKITDFRCGIRRKTDSPADMFRRILPGTGRPADKKESCF